MRLYIVPTIRRPAFLAASTLAKLTGLIMPSRRLVSAAVCHLTLKGLSSTRSAKIDVRVLGEGRFHHVQDFCELWDSLPNASTNADECHVSPGPSARSSEATEQMPFSHR